MRMCWDDSYFTQKQMSRYTASVVVFFQKEYQRKSNLSSNLGLKNSGKWIRKFLIIKILVST